jgi:transposase InsO family protein
VDDRSSCGHSSDSASAPLSGLGAEHPRIASLLHEFSDVLVSEFPDALPPVRRARDGTLLEHVIETAPDEKPFARPPRVFSDEETKEIRKYLDDFLAKGWITPSLSPWAAPVLFVPKKRDPVTGERTWRMCISYVKLNSKTLNRIAYRLPRISDLLMKVSRSKYFSKLDLLSGFYQIRMRSQDIEKTGFATPFGNFQFKVMPMGLCGAPGTFQRMMDETFSAPVTIRGQSVPFDLFACVYLDDICVHSLCIEDHLLHVRAALQRLRDRQLFAKPTKCVWMQTSIEFLGHAIGPTGMSITTFKRDALQSWPEPSTVHEVRSLLGTFGFWRSYIRNYAAITQPLTALTRKNVRFHFGEVERKALNALKQAVTDSPVLLPVDSTKPFWVVTDASDYAIGASLEQEADACQRRPVAYFSHLLSSAEQAYPTHERELLAIVLALRTWKHLLMGSEFSVVCQTDHRPLQAFLSQSNLSARQVRWQMFLSEFNLQVRYIPGKANAFADGLSRVRLQLVSAMGECDTWFTRIQEAVRTDSEANEIRKKAINFDDKSNADQFVLLHGVLYWRSKGTLRVYVPAPLRDQLLHEFHDLPIAGHLGWRKTYLALHQHYYWPHMPEHVQQYVSRCVVCQRVKSTRQPTPPIRPLPVPSKPFEMITLDWLTALPTDKFGHTSLLNIVDRFSKWAIAVPCTKKMNTADLCDCLFEHVFSWVGLPLSIVGDRDSRLTASQIRYLTKFLGLKLKLSTAYHPQTDGETERFHSTLLQMLRCFVSRYQNDWSSHIPAMLYAYHNTVHTATGYTPHMLLFGWSPRDLRAPLAAEEKSGDKDVDLWLRSRRRAFEKAQVSLEAARAAMIRAQKHADNYHTYEVGDQVKVSTRVLPLRATSTQVAKLMPKWIGPFTVESVQDKVVRLKMPETYKHVHDKFNIIDLRPWLHSEEHTVEVDYPPVEPHPTLNPVVQVLDRKRYGRAPLKPASLLDIPATYFVVRRDGSTQWVRGRELTAPNEISLVKKFEYRFKRTEDLPCNPVSSYSVEKVLQEADDISDDEVDIVWAAELNQHFDDVF